MSLLVSHEEMLEIITKQIMEAARKAWETKATVVCDFELHGCKVSVTPLASSRSG